MPVYNVQLVALYALYIVQRYLIARNVLWNVIKTEDNINRNSVTHGWDLFSLLNFSFASSENLFVIHVICLL